MQRGVVLARVDLEEPVIQEEATEAAAKQAGDEVPTPHEARALEASEAEAPTTTEAIEAKAEASLGAVEPSVQDAEMGAGQALVRPPVQDPPSS